MAVSIRVDGANEFAEVSKRLKKAGNGKELRKELNSGITKAVRPLRKDVRAHARSTLPKSGGLARLISRQPIRVRKRTAGRMAGVRVVSTSEHDIYELDSRGRLRHPLFGNRDWWYQQLVRRGWFTDPMLRGAPKARREILHVIRRVARRIEG